MKKVLDRLRKLSRKTKAMTKPKKPAQKGKKMATITFRPEPEVAEMLELAIEATGNKKGHLINEAVQAELPRLVQRIMDRQKKHGDAFFERVSSPDKQ